MKIISVTRHAKNPILQRKDPKPDPAVGVNMMGSCLKFINGKWHWYFSAHNGSHIRLMTSATLDGPWTIYPGGVLSDNEVAPWRDTISAPDVHILGNKLRMYAHCDLYGPLAPPNPKPPGYAPPNPRPAGWGQQFSFVAESTDGGFNFALVHDKPIGKYYIRAFPWAGKWYALQKGWSTAAAELVVSPDGIQPFTHLKTFTAHGSIRHMGVKIDGTTLIVAFSRIGDSPERLMFSTIDLSKPDSQWTLSPPVVGFRAETQYEGVQYTPVPSFKGGGSHVNQLRDPYLFVDGGKTHIAYSGSGEDCLCLAQINYDLNAQGTLETAAPPPGSGGSGGDGSGGGSGGDGGGGNTGGGDGNTGGGTMITKATALQHLAELTQYVTGSSTGGGTGGGDGGSTKPPGGDGGKPKPPGGENPKPPGSGDAGKKSGG